MYYSMVEPVFIPFLICLVHLFYTSPIVQYLTVVAFLWCNVFVSGKLEMLTDPETVLHRKPTSKLLTCSHNRERARDDFVMTLKLIPDCGEPSLLQSGRECASGRA